jgi:DNA-binding NarL/FixJ family response regulator
LLTDSFNGSKRELISGRERLSAYSLNSISFQWDADNYLFELDTRDEVDVSAFLTGASHNLVRFLYEQEINTLRILVADDHDIIRRGLKELLTSRSGWEVCAEAKTGREAVMLAEQLRPDVVVMDISMPDLNGLEAARKIRKSLPKTEILILTLHFSDQLVREIVEAGVRAYIMKSDADRDLVAAVEALANHRPFFTARAADMLLDGFVRPHAAPPDPDAVIRNRLTSREREIVQLLAEGKSSKEVAVSLGISVKTAETHRANIMRKLELHSVSELVRYAVRNQIIEA